MTAGAASDRNRITAPSPVVAVFDPVRAATWTYDVERSMLATRGVALVVPGDRTDDAAGDAAIRDADVVIVSGNRRLDAERIGALRRCVGILCYSVGMDKVDGAAAAAAKIAVRNVPDYCTDEVADHALMLLLAAERRLLPVASRAGRGEWSTARVPELRAIRRLRGQTLGILGAGRIGRQVARKARAFGFRTIAHDPFLTAVDDPDLELRPLADVLALSDALVLCAALTRDSRRIINAEALAAMKPGVLLVNVARGDLIDEDALAVALKSGRVAVAALDVRSPEPPDPASDPLSGLENVILTPHVAATAIEAENDLHRKAAENVLAMLESAGRIVPT